MVLSIQYLILGHALTIIALRISTGNSFQYSSTLSRSSVIPWRLRQSTRPNHQGVEQDNPQVPLVKEFVHQVQASINDQTFLSLTLLGPSISKKKKPKGKQLLEDDESSQLLSSSSSSLRGSIRQVDGRLIQLKKNKKNQVSSTVLLQLTIKYHGATDICKNMAVEDIPHQLSQLILEPLASEWGIEVVQPLERAELKTIHQIWELKSLHKQSQTKLQKKKVPIPPNQDLVMVAQPPASHDRQKQVPLASNLEFLQALGVTKPDGSPRPGMTSKLRQCNKFVEIVTGLIGKTTPEHGINVVDMGCGRGYLTFALHSYLCDNYPHVASLGIDVRPKLVEEISGIAQSLGGTFDTLSFQTGTIEEIVGGTTTIFGGTPQHSKQVLQDPHEDSLKILIALHACDTATDDALWSGISQQADIIVVAPCCHKQVRPQLNAHLSSCKDSHPLYDVLKHGVYRERLSETVTDSLRALLLEQAGYKVQVFEFIGGEHTSKNVMITAIRDYKLSILDSSDTHMQQRIQDLAAFHGIKEQKLADWMKYDLTRQGDAAPASRSPKIRTTQMPPKSRKQP